MTSSLKTSTTIHSLCEHFSPHLGQEPPVGGNPATPCAQILNVFFREFSKITSAMPEIKRCLAWEVFPYSLSLRATDSNPVLILDLR